MISLKIIVAQIWTVIAAMLTVLAHMWLSPDYPYGLNPWISLPAATLCMAIPHIIHKWLDARDYIEPNYPPYIEVIDQKPVLDYPTVH